MTSIRFNVHWHGELAAGIRPGYENVVITLEYTESVDADTLEYWREAVRDYYDGATVETEQEARERIIRTGTCPGCGHPIHDPKNCRVHIEDDVESCECSLGRP